MGAGAAQIAAGERHAVTGAAQYRSGRAELIEPDLAVEDVAAGQAEAPLEVERRQRQTAEHRGGEAGRVSVDGGDDVIRRFLAARVPAALHFIREMLAEEAGDMPARRGEA